MSQEADNAWKDILDAHLEEFFAFFFPEVHADIDWTKPVEFLDKELARIVPQSLQGQAIVDKLVKVSMRGGETAVIFIHIEIQGYGDPEFEVRMLRYNLRLRERYGNAVVSLAVLTDSDPRYRPSAFEYRRWGFHLRMAFPVVKLLDYRGLEKDLEMNPNPFAIVVLAHLARVDRPTVEGVYRSKWRLVKLLYQRGHGKQQIQDLLRFIDWILRLPKELEARIMSRTEALEQRHNMPYLSNIERRGIEKGLREFIGLALDFRFGAHALDVMPKIESIDGAEKLRRLADELKIAPSLEVFLAAVERERV